MNVLQVLRQRLEDAAPQQPREERLCTCGEPNHVRIALFRINHSPAIVLLPEGARLSVEQFREVSGQYRIEPLPEQELEVSACELCEPALLGPSPTAVYCDQSLLDHPSLVFCPEMFTGRRGECYRVPTGVLLEAVRPVVLPLVSQPVADLDDWAV